MLNAARRFGSGELDRVEQAVLGLHHAHAAAAAAAGGLDNHREADFSPELYIALVVIVERAVRTGHRRHPGGFHRLDRGDLVAHRADGRGAGSDELEAAGFDLLGEFGVFGEKAVTRMDAVGVGQLGGADDGRDIQVAFQRRCRADADRLVGEAYVLQVAVGGRMHRDRLDVHFAAGAQNAQRDFTPVGD